ncbi:MAG: hypothetical protein JHC38_00605 [Thiotrichales bacterium]|jgi:hypothetical protein|nr:hypothetical protein [Thiotrichales bacterium]
MMRMIFLLLNMSVMAMNSGCTTDAWRASTQEVVKQQCEQAPATERDRCLERLRENK